MKSLKHCFLLQLLIRFLFIEGHGQQGKVLESLKYSSKILAKEVKYSVFLPQDYATSDRRYPVV